MPSTLAATGWLGGALLVASFTCAEPARAQTPKPVQQAVFVETPVDTDRDGRLDRVRVVIVRPSTRQRVPVIFEHSPYAKVGTYDPNRVNVDRLPSGGTRPDPSTLRHPLVRRYVSRGYAIALGESIGTGRSDGCPTVGDRSETLGGKAVIDWLNGRATARDARGRLVRADWATGAVGMIGFSYDGGLANMVATTGVQGLKAVISQAAIASWYDYFRANGLVAYPHGLERGRGYNVNHGLDVGALARFIGGERCPAMRRRLVRLGESTAGDFTPFWAEREPLSAVSGVKAPVLVVHGLNDFNVRPKQFADWWAGLAGAAVPRKLWLHSGGHVPVEDAAYLRTERRWFDRWLRDVPNGIDAEAPVRLPGGSAAAWPAPEARAVRLHLGARGATSGALRARAPQRGLVQSFVDRGRLLDPEVLLRDPTVAHANRLAFTTSPLRHAVRLSGTPTVSLRMAVQNRRTANLTALLVAYPPNGGRPRVITRGWLDPRNRAGRDQASPLRRGELYDLTWNLQPADTGIRAGQRLGLVVISTDRRVTLRPRPGTRIRLATHRSSIQLPVVGSLRLTTPER